MAALLTLPFHDLDGLPGENAVSDFAQGHHRGFVIGPGDQRFDAIGQLSRPLGGEQHQIEAVVDMIEAVLDSNACHG